MIVELRGALPVLGQGEQRRSEDGGELEGVYRDSGVALVGLARLLLDDPGEAEEVVQEAFIRTLVAWPGVRNRDNPLPYVRGVVVNLARGGLRRRRSARRWRPDPQRHAVSAESIVVESLHRSEVTRAVLSLPRRQRECIVLRYYGECTIAEVADAAGISLGAVKQHLHRALASLGRVLEESEH